ncbi:SIS domain-containing protein [Micromonospora chalcea]|uniref:SIS domain-containing protein n=1 Tax=Micromonospora chalcea TaxID=1874 RepID=UPI0037A0CAE1
MNILRGHLPAILDIGEFVARRVQAGATVFLEGNGGSHSLVEHLGGELIGRLGSDAPPIGAVVLQNSPPVTSALSNDFGFENAMERELRALCRPGDVFIAVSGSGESANLIRAAEAANSLAVSTICLVGKRYSRLAMVSTRSICCSATSTVVAQQLHMVLMHSLRLAIEASLASVGTR